MINMNKNSVKYLQGTNFSQLTLAKEDYNEELKSRNTCLFIAPSYSSRKQTYVRKFDVILTVHHR